MYKVLQRTTLAVHHAAQPAMLRDPRDIALGLRRSVAPSPRAGKRQYLASSRYMLPQFVQMKDVSRQLPMLRQGQSHCRSCDSPNWKWAGPFAAKVIFTRDGLYSAANRQREAV